jgi:hypothetical protein
VTTDPQPDWPTDQLYRYAAEQLDLSTARGLWRAGRALLTARERAADDEVWLAAATCYVRRPMPLLVTALTLARRPCPGPNETTAAACLALLYAADPTLAPRRRAGGDDTGADPH